MAASGDSVIESDGSIDWQRLGAVVAGIVSIPVFTGIADVIRTVYSVFLITPLERLAGVASTAVSAPFETFEFTLYRAYQTATRTVEASGLFGFVVALGIVVAVAYLAASSGVFE
jgi:hypothetical protein